MKLNDIIKVAAARLKGAKNAEYLRREITSIEASSLAKDAAAFLAVAPNAECAQVLRSLVELNQGRFEDLHRSDFSSYLRATLHLTEDQYTEARQALRTFLLSLNENRSDYAARGAEREIEASDKEFMQLIARRQRAG